MLLRGAGGRGRRGDELLERDPVGLTGEPLERTQHEVGRVPGHVPKGTGSPRDGRRRPPRTRSSKGAVVMMTKTAALEYAQRGVRVNAVGPGIIRTPWLDNLDADLIDTLAQQVPQGRIGESAEAANVVAFLASDEASHVTGQVWLVDGGRSAG
nr:SDR family oxidoreductase [Cellulomonas fimi]